MSEVIQMLSTGKKFPDKYKNHKLKGKYEGYYDCHILPNLVLVYKIEKEKLIWVLFDSGSHSNLF
ncbi:MAG: type II toxin-antitoxin system YafQ family toxin [Clostridia bacterium]|nr:type II toxin-antitoxin system YafQ family toxin [Clostridia bacterium]